MDVVKIYLNQMSMAVQQLEDFLNMKPEIHSFNWQSAISCMQHATRQIEACLERRSYVMDPYIQPRCMQCQMMKTQMAVFAKQFREQQQQLIAHACQLRQQCPKRPEVLTTATQTDPQPLNDESLSERSADIKEQIFLEAKVFTLSRENQKLQNQLKTAAQVLQEQREMVERTCKVVARGRVDLQDANQKIQERDKTIAGLVDDLKRAQAENNAFSTSRYSPERIAGWTAGFQQIIQRAVQLVALLRRHVDTIMVANSSLISRFNQRSNKHEEDLALLEALQKSTQLQFRQLQDALQLSDNDLNNLAEQQLRHVTSRRATQETAQQAMLDNSAVVVQCEDSTEQHEGLYRKMPYKPISMISEKITSKEEHKKKLQEYIEAERNQLSDMTILRGLRGLSDGEQERVKRDILVTHLCELLQTYNQRADAVLGQPKGQHAEAALQEACKGRQSGHGEVSAQDTVRGAKGTITGRTTTPMGEPMPLMGFGTGKLGPEVAGAAVTNALKIGYTFIDLAYSYGNEVEIAQAINRYLADFPRNRLYIVSKLAIWNHSPADVARQADEQLEYLRIGYFDLFLIHWPVPVASREDRTQQKRISIQQTWRAMEKLVQQGKARNIGVCNFPQQLLQDLLMYATIKPYCNQIEVHPFNQNDRLIDFCIRSGVQVVAYSPLGGQNRQQSLLQELSADETLQRIAERHKVTVCQLILLWHLQKHPCHYHVIPKAVQEDHMIENFQVLDLRRHITLDTSELCYIGSLDRRQRSCDPRFYFGLPLLD